MCPLVLLINVMTSVLCLIDKEVTKWNGLYFPPIYFKTMDIWYWEFGEGLENVVVLGFVPWCCGMAALNFHLNSKNLHFNFTCWSISLYV